MTDAMNARFRIVVAECKQEVSSFNPQSSSDADFRLLQSAEMFEYHRTVDEEVGGALSVFDSETDVEAVPAVGASSITSGGILDAESFQRVSTQFVDGLTAAGPVDAAYLSLHGAMQADGESDPEGHLIEEARRILGSETPIIVSLDLHGILTDRMLEHCDAVVVYHTYPHVDFFETGARAARLCLRILRDGVRPVTARVRIPALVRGDELITETGAVHDCIQRAQQIENGPAGLSAAVMWGNPFTDVPELRSNAVVVMDGDESAASEHAIDLANRFWKHHESMQVPLTGLEESVRLAAEVTSGTVVLMDAADATSSGASGDSNAIIAELVRQNYSGTVLAPIVDPAAVRLAFDAGIGGEIETTAGGSIDAARFQPLPVRGRVRMLSDGRFRSESFGWHWDSGDTAVIEAGTMTLLVGTRPVSLFDRSWFYAHGLDPKRFDVVIVKSPHCEPHMFADWCARLINVDAPGSTSANLRSLGHTQCARPIFPLDEDVHFEPGADIFRR